MWCGAVSGGVDLGEASSVSYTHCAIVPCRRVGRYVYLFSVVGGVVGNLFI